MIGLATGRNDLGIDAVCPVNWLHPLNRDLLSWWLVLPGRAGGTILGDLTTRNPGTLTSMDPPTDWTGALGRSGGFGSLEFDGSTHVVSGLLAVNSAQANNAMTASVWVRDTIGEASGGRYCLSTSMTNATYDGRGFRMSIDDRVGFNAVITAGFNLPFSPVGRIDASYATSPLVPYTWHMLTYTFRTGEQRLFLNGNQIGSASDSSSMPNPNKGFQIGRLWGGQVDDVRIWQRALSAAEVQSVYRDSLRGYPETLRRVRMPRAYAAGTPPVTGNASNLLLLGVG